MPDLTHLSAAGQAQMVDVSGKPVTARVAVAEGRILMQKPTLELALSGNAKKGDVFAAARIAAILAAKKTHELIPLCHPLSLTKIAVDLEADPAMPGVKVQVMAKVLGQTGVEMEALTGVSIACLTIYDMLKAVDRAMRIEGIELVHKSGGKSGEFLRDEVASKRSGINCRGLR
jgi:cyclic pyranopterin phosphate synthase